MDDVVGSLLALLARLDSQAEIRVDLPSSRAKGACELMDVGGVMMYSRFSSSTVKTIATQPEYLARLTIIVKELVKNISNREPKKARKMFYEQKKRGINEALLEKIVTTLGLSIRVHPALLGIVREEKGLLWIPKGVKIEFKTVPNVFEWIASGKRNSSTTLVTFGQGEYLIPTMILRVKVYGAEQLKGIAFSEHRNVGTTLRWTEENSSGFLYILASTPHHAC